MTHPTDSQPDRFPWIRRDADEGPENLSEEFMEDLLEELRTVNRLEHFREDDQCSSS